MAHEATSREQICCPHCLAEYNFSDAKPDYIHSIKGFDENFYVALCYNCRGLIQAQKKIDIKHIVHRIGLNIFSNPDKRLSVATEVEMVMNNHRFSDALLNGHGLNRKAYNAVKKGNYWKLSCAQPGLIMMWTTE
jgi:hypothetical protein